MEKMELKKSFLLKDEYDNQDKERYLQELGESVHHYIKTGVKNKQLDNLISLEEDFRVNYEKQFDIKKVTNLLYESSRKSIRESDKLLKLEVVNNEGTLEKMSEQIVTIAVETIGNRLEKIMIDAAYLSHMNMLYELYEKEERLRREEKEYQKISSRHRKIADIAKKLSEERRMELEELQEQTNTSQKEMEQLLTDCNKYFNIRDRKGNIQISLSPAGKKYTEYILNAERTYSNDTLNQLVYKNCNSLMDALENSCERGVEYNLQLEGINFDKERAIRHKYCRTLRSLMIENEEGYQTLNFKMETKKESVNEKNEENRFTIPTEWDDDFNWIV